MTDTALRLKDELLRLSEEDRLELARVLLDSVESPDEFLENDGSAEKDEGYDDAWERELGRRIEEIESGTAVDRPAKEVFDELRKRYPQRDGSL